MSNRPVFKNLNGRIHFAFALSQPRATRAGDQRGSGVARLGAGRGPGGAAPFPIERLMRDPMVAL